MKDESERLRALGHDLHMKAPDDILVCLRCGDAWPMERVRAGTFVDRTCNESLDSVHRVLKLARNTP